MFDGLGFAAQLGVVIGAVWVVGGIVNAAWQILKALRSGEITPDDLINAPSHVPPYGGYCRTCRTVHPPEEHYP